jgi:thioredoxin 1
MATVTLTRENFDQTIEENEIVLLDFWAPWCGPCKTFGPIFEAASEEHDDIVFGKVNTQEQPGIAQAFGVRSIPTVAVFRDQIPVFAQPGLLPEHALEDLIAQVRTLDMDDVRAEYEKHLEEHGGAS